mgnify:FL=1|tara:strand:+ start:4089 stop:6884 length:2796 start_codon:yes stop_codon:yes gene_type:complete
MEFEQFSFNHSDSNFAEVSYDGSKVANQALAETDKIYAAAYERAKQNALADAETRSRNFQKFGKLIGQGVEFKKKLDAWNDTRSLREDQREGTYEGKDGKIYDTNTGELVPGQDDKVAKENAEAEKELSKEVNQNKVEAESLAAQEVEKNNAAPDSKNQATETLDTLTIRNIPTYDENSAATAKKAVNWTSNFVGQNLNTPLSNAAVPGANGRSYNQLMADGDSGLADEALFFWGRSGLMQSGAMSTLKGRHKNKMLDDLRKNINGISTKGLNRKIEEELKLGEVKEILNLSDMLVNNPEMASEYLFGTDDDPNSGLLTRLAHGAPGGKKDMNFAYAKLGDRLDKAFEQGYIGTTELQLIRDTYFTQRGTNGKVKTNLAGVNTPGATLLDNKLGELIMRSQKKDIEKRELEITNKAETAVNSAIEGYKDLPDDVVLTRDMVTKDLHKIAKDLGLPVTDPKLKKLADYYVPGDYDDEEESRFILLDAADGKIDSGTLEARLAAIKDGDIRKRTKTDAEELINGFKPSSALTAKANKMFNALVNTKTDKSGNVIVQDPDLASIQDLETITNMGIAYEEEYRIAFMQTNNANKAHQIAVDKIKANYADPKQKSEVIGLDGKKQSVGPYDVYPPPGQPENDPQRYLLQDKLLDRLNKDDEDYSNTLGSEMYLPGEESALPLGVRALKKQNGQIPEFYLNLSRKTGIHPLKLMKQRVEALGLDIETIDPDKIYFVKFPDDGMSERDQERLNRFPTPSNLIQIMSQEIYSSDNMSIFKDQMAAKGADHNTFRDRTGRSYSDSFNIQTKSMTEVGELFTSKGNRSGVLTGAGIQIGKYKWNKSTFNKALQRSGLPADAPFNAKNQELLLRAHQNEILYGDNQLGSMSSFTGGATYESIEPVNIDFDDTEFDGLGYDSFSMPNSISRGLMNTYYLTEID